ncbi:hypothetical protein JKP88DRAFT_338267 [Tribonema minus]|uniref:THH1/TOM1/TOM3 domain-containing protein n=1 Tax=Tribonema minus TaxID=303371 RepID=A0A836C8B0_9STRA|nr:hypothetical protein JKP88DRAFT_338267 [Tribonema minus]
MLSDPQCALAGLVTTALAAAIAAWRLLVVLRQVWRYGGWRRVLAEPFSKDAYEDLDRQPHHYATQDQTLPQEESLLPQRAMFHVLVFLCLAVEVPVYAYHYVTLRGQDVSFEVGRDLYALHLTSYLLLCAAFCIIVMLWSSVASFEPSAWLLLANRLLLVLCVLYFLVTAVAVGRCLCEASSSQSYFTSLPFITFCAFSIGALLLLAACFLVLGCLMQQRICSALGGPAAAVAAAASNGSASAVGGEKRGARRWWQWCRSSATAAAGSGGGGGGVLTGTVLRLNAVVLTCFVCFSARALLLVRLLRLETAGADALGGWTRWQQEVYVEWIPNVVPCLALLYLMRGDVAREGRGLGGAGDGAAAAAAAAAAGAAAGGARRGAAGGATAEAAELLERGDETPRRNVMNGHHRQYGAHR